MKRWSCVKSREVSTGVWSELHKPIVLHFLSLKKELLGLDIYVRSVGVQTFSRALLFRSQRFRHVRGDVEHRQGFTSEGEAIVAVKTLIAGNPSLCGMLSRLRKKGTYTIYIKEIQKTNPSRNQNNWDKCKMIFYGNRMLHANELQKIQKMHEDTEFSQGLFEYFIVKGLDMCGGDFSKSWSQSYEQAYSECIQLLDYDASKCGMILEGFETEKCKYYVKNPRKCNPSASDSKNHKRCTSIFVGRQV